MGEDDPDYIIEALAESAKSMRLLCGYSRLFVQSYYKIEVGCWICRIDGIPLASVPLLL